MNQNMDPKEVREAILAGEQLLRKLDQVLGELKGAQGWGFFDMLGGGMFSTFMKRDKMRKAENMMQDVNYYANQFRKELGDLDIPMGLDLTNDSFLGFADYFFDNFFVDFMVQSKIRDGIDQIESYRERVEDILFRLQPYDRR